MSTTSINFLKERRCKLTRQQAQDKQLFVIARVVAIVAIILLAISAGTRFAMAMLVRQEETTQENLLASIAEQEDSERSYVIFAAKLKTLSELFSQRSDKQEAITFFSTIFGEGVLISDITYEGKNSSVTFGLKAADVFTLDRVIAILKSPQVTDQFKSVKTESLSRGGTGEYQATVTVILTDQAASEAPRSPTTSGSPTPLNN